MPPPKTQHDASSEQRDARKFCKILFVTTVLLVIVTKCTRMHNAFVESVVETKNDTLIEVMQMMRGDNYDLADESMGISVKQTAAASAAENTPKKQSGRALVTWFHVSHFALYAVLGFCAPGRWAWALGISAVWETVEVFWRCHDMMDLAWNALGYACGMALRKQYDARPVSQSA